MAKDNEEKWVSMTNKQIETEASAGKKTSESCQNVHPPLEPIPDTDWVGDTWGLFWPDLEEFDELKEDPEKYIKKHYDDKNTKDHPPADLEATIRIIETSTCPKEKTPKPKTPTPPPAVVLRTKQPRSPSMTPPCDIDNDNSKWDWMKSKDQSSAKARFSLSMYW